MYTYIVFTKVEMENIAQQHCTLNIVDLTHSVNLFMNGMEAKFMQLSIG